jgi:dihydrodipicolinate synthase/N-acetylneuraminate lyase
MTRPFFGIIPPVITPLTDRDTLDQAGLERLIEHLISGGVHGLFILGTTGEAPSLGYRLRRELIERTCKLTAGRVPVLVGITDTAFVESVGVAHHAAECGAAAVVLSTPYYFPAGQTELLGYVQNLLPQLPLPLVLYNMPSLTKVWFELDTLKKLTDQERIVGIKDSSGDLKYFESLMSLRAARPDWSIMIGPEAMLPQAMKLGGDGGVTGGGNAYPRLFVECYQACVAGDAARIALPRRIARSTICRRSTTSASTPRATSRRLSAPARCWACATTSWPSRSTNSTSPERARVRQILDSLTLPENCR